MAALERVGTQVVAVPLFAVLGDLYSFYQNLKFFLITSAKIHRIETIPAG